MEISSRISITDGAAAATESNEGIHIGAVRWSIACEETSIGEWLCTDIKDCS